MQLEQAEQLAWSLMKQFGLTVNGWMFHWDDGLKRFGSCSQSRRRITLSRNLTTLNDLVQVEDTIRHEIAHALAPAKAGHGWEWKQQCRITGAKPVRCYQAKDVVAVVGDWSATCKGCGQIFYKHRQPSGGKKACRECCRKYGRHRFDEFVLVYRHKNAVAPVVVAERRTAIDAIKAQMRREQEMEEMKSRITELESKLGK